MADHLSRRLSCEVLHSMHAQVICPPSDVERYLGRVSMLAMLGASLLPGLRHQGRHGESYTM